MKFIPSHVPCIFGRPLVKRFALCYRTVVLSVLSVCDVGVLWPNGWMDQDQTWHEGGPRPRPQCVRWGHSPLKKAGNRAHVCCGQTAGWVKMPLGTEIDLGPRNIVLDGDPAPPSPKVAQHRASFRPMSVVAKRSPISATIEHVLNLMVKRALKSVDFWRSYRQN